MRITVANVEELHEAAENLIEAASTWLEYQEDSEPEDSEPEDRQDAREELESEIFNLSTILLHGAVVPHTRPTAKPKGEEK
jgi:hypothetical protein